MLMDGQFKLLGGEHILLLYIVNARDQIKNELFPEKLQFKIKSMLGWYNAKMKVSGSLLMRARCDPVKDSQK